MESEVSKKSVLPDIDLSNFSLKDALAKQALSESEKRNKEAMRLVRVEISSNNPNKKSYIGEIFCVRNAVINEVKKFVPFNKPTHIPQIMYNMLKEKMCQHFVEQRLPNGSKVMKSKLIPEYSIVVLPPLTAKEIEAIRQHQLADKDFGE